jgi:hypothetical protein
MSKEDTNQKSKFIDSDSSETLARIWCINIKIMITTPVDKITYAKLSNKSEPLKIISLKMKYTISTQEKKMIMLFFHKLKRMEKK